MVGSLGIRESDDDDDNEDDVIDIKWDVIDDDGDDIIGDAVCDVTVCDIETWYCGEEGGTCCSDDSLDNSDVGICTTRGCFKFLQRAAEVRFSSLQCSYDICCKHKTHE